LLGVLFNFVIHYDQFYSSLLEHLNRVLIGVVTLFTNHSCDAGIYYHHGASSARRHLAKKRSTLERYAKSSGLDNCVLFSVKCPHAVLGYVPVEIRYLANIVSCVLTVWQTRRSSNVTRGHDSFAFDNHAAAASTVASGALRNRFAEV